MNNRLNNFTRVLSLILLSGGLSLLVASCGSGINIQTVSTQSPSSNPSPTVTTASPVFLVAGAPPSTLTITGSGFFNGTSASFGAKTHVVTYIDPQTISIQLDSSEIATAGSYTLTVTNNSPGGGSAGLTLAVWQPYLDPATSIAIAFPKVSNSLMFAANTSSSGGSITPEVFQPGSTQPVPAFSIDVDMNSQKLSLHDWFEKNVDVNGTLLSSGAYVPTTLSSGMVAFIPGTGSTQAYSDAGGIGAILAAAYAQTSAGPVVTLVLPGDGSSFQDDGYLPTNMSLSDLGLAALGTAHF